MIEIAQLAALMDLVVLSDQERQAIRAGARRQPRCAFCGQPIIPPAEGGKVAVFLSEQRAWAHWQPCWERAKKNGKG